MESLIYKENVSRLPPLSQRKRTKVSSTTNVKSPSSKMYDSPEMLHDACRNTKSSVTRSYTRNNVNMSTVHSSSPAPEDSCQHLSYVILQQLANAEHQNALIHDKLIYNEQKMVSMTEEVTRVKMKISDLEEKLQKKPEMNCCCLSGNGCKQLQEKCNIFEQKIKALEELLAQHSSSLNAEDWNNTIQNSSSKLENSSEKSNEAPLWVPDCSIPTERAPIDFDKLLRAIQELNLIAGQGESKLCYTKSGATFQRLTGIPLILYANGIILNNGQFRSYEDESTQQFLQDILDGYFPSEFQNDYPDGVPLQVDDKHHMDYEPPKQTWSAFSGKGYRLGNGTSKSNSEKSPPSRLVQEFSKSK